MKQYLLSTTALAYASLAAATEYCSPAGIPLLPLPDLSIAPKFDPEPLKAALDRLNSEAILFNTSSTSYSVSITTTEDTVFQYHWTAPNVNTTVGVSEVNGDTVYRIFSGELGLPENATVPEGFPICNSIEFGLCATREGKNSLRACYYLRSLLNLIAEFLEGALISNYVWPVGRTPAYSNYAFVILGYAIESFTGKSLRDVIADSITGPLGLTSATGLDSQDASLMVIPGEVDHFGTQDIGEWNGTAGMFSTPKDLARFVRGLLNNELLSSTDMAKWLKPASFTSSSRGEAVGMPWTVLRPTSLGLDSGERPVDIYTMPGGQGYYNAYAAIIPEYQLGYTVNVAGVGDDPALRALLDHLVRYSVPHFDTVGREQVRENYAGRYGSGESAIELVVDDGPGLKVQSWTTGGKAVSDAWVEFFGSAALNAVDADVRIYPIGADNRWRVAFRGISDLNSTGIFEDACYTWFSHGAWLYAGLPVDEMVISLGENGTATMVSVPGLRQNLARS
ncbi:beta-lactamase/transpeptidase-like protein [Alternaria alternata]|nr:beta-lactamase/transpeptidase-like protein [Alternaria alternata]